jgi:hypothetical protein
MGKIDMRNLLDRARRARVALWVAVATCLATAPSLACAEEHHHDSDSDWLLFPAGQVMGRSDTHERAPENDYDNLQVDVLLSHSSGRFRVLAETEVSPDEVEIERLQVGYEFAENLFGWAGRFHQPASAWNTEHHHGQYLQTAITRPQIEHWEDEHGLIPQHIAGLLIETTGSLGRDGGLAASLGAGAAPVIRDGKMEPVGVLKANHGAHRASWSGRLAYEPELLGEDSFGILLAQHDVGVVDPAVMALFASNDVRLDVGGAFAKLSRRDWRVQATYYFVNVHFDTAAPSRNETFGAGYLQVERSLPQRLTPFARLEDSAKAAQSSYVAIQAREFELRRQLLGLRWDFAHNQALTLEAAHATTLLARFNEVRLQWSGVIP